MGQKHFKSGQRGNDPEGLGRFWMGEDNADKQLVTISRKGKKKLNFLFLEPSQKLDLNLINIFFF